MSNFIEIKCRDERRRLINVDYIEEVVEREGEGCYIYMAFNCPDCHEQDYFEVDKSYEEIIDMLEYGGEYDW